MKCAFTPKDVYLCEKTEESSEINEHEKTQETGRLY